MYIGSFSLHTGHVDSFQWVTNCSEGLHGLTRVELWEKKNSIFFGVVSSRTFVTRKVNEFMSFRGNNWSIDAIFNLTWDEVLFPKTFFQLSQNRRRGGGGGGGRTFI